MGAFEAIDSPVSMWWHYPSRCLVVENQDCARVGIQQSEGDDFDLLVSGFDLLRSGV